MLLLAAGVSAAQIDERADDVRAACCEQYARLCPPDLSDKVIAGHPGAAAAAARAATDVTLSLVTGNYEPVGRLKLTRAGLGHFFAAGQGGFGSDAEDRALLPEIARQRAGTDGIPFAARADDRDRRHAARHRLRPRRRRALPGGRDRPLRRRAAAGRRRRRRRHR